MANLFVDRPPAQSITTVGRNAPVAAPPNLFGDTPPSSDTKPHRPIMLRGMEGLGDVGKAPIVGPAVQFLDDATEGWNRHLAGILAMPVDGVRAITAKVRGMENPDPDAAYNALIAFADEVGITESQRKDLDEFAENLGRDGIEAVLMGGGLGAAAGKLTRAGAGKVSKFVGGMGQSIKAHPVSYAASEAAASGAATSAEKVLEGTGYEPAGRFAAAVFGGSLVGKMTATSRGMARDTIPNKPLFDPRNDPDVTIRLAQNSVQEAMAHTNARIEALGEDITRRFTGGVIRHGRTPEAIAKGTLTKAEHLITPWQGAVRAQTAVRAAETEAHNVETLRWDNIDAARPVPNAATELQDLAALIRAQFISDPASLPHRILTMIDGLDGEAALGDLIGAGSIRSEALAMMRRLHRNTDGGGELAHNLNQIQESALDAVRGAYPDDEPIAAALEYSRWMNDAFYRRNSHLRPFVIGEMQHADSDQLLKGLLSHGGAGATIAQVTRQVQQQELTHSFHQAIRDEFRGLMYNLGHGKTPEGTKRAMDFISSESVRRFMREFPGEAADITVASTDMKELWDSRELLTSSTFGMLAGPGKTPEGVAQEIVGALDRSAPMVKEIMQGIGAHGPTPDLTAVQGFQASVSNELMRRAGYSVETLQKSLRQPGTQAMLRELFPNPTDLSRFHRIVEDLAAVERNEIGTGRKILRKPVSLASKVVGSWVGRKGTGAGTLQAASTGAGIFESLSSRFFAMIDMDKAFGRMIVNPYYEKMIHATLPRNRREAARFKRLTDVVISGMTAGWDKDAERRITRNLPDELKDLADKHIPNIFLNAGERDRMAKQGGW